MAETTGKILVVDDDQAVRSLLTEVLGNEYEIWTASGGEEAIEISRQVHPDLVLLDLMMPDMDGYDTCRLLRSEPGGKRMHVIVVSAASSYVEQLRALKCGADDYVVKPFDAHGLRSRVRLHFRLRQAEDQLANVRAEVESQSSQAHRAMEVQRRELMATQDVAVFVLAKVAECRDHETGNHLVRMRNYSQLLAEELQRNSPYANQIDPQFLDDLFRSSPLHDVGKVGISDRILLKPGRLTPDEFEQMKEHTTLGAQILDEAVWQQHGGAFLAMAAQIARHHHERFDGTGYPSGLAGTDIPLAARIVAVADVFDALTSKRPYKPAYSPLDSKEMILVESGRHFDPVVVQAFENCFEDILKIQRQFTDQTPVAAAELAEATAQASVAN